MHVRTRSHSFVPAGGVLHWSRSRPGSNAQSHQATSTRSVGVPRSRSTDGSLSVRRSSERRSTLLRRTPVRSRPSSREDHRSSRVTRLLISAVQSYQEAFAGRPSPCRFTPSCSCYTMEALESHGAARGSWLAVRRLARCRPFGPSGFDPVPYPSSKAR